MFSSMLWFSGIMIIAMWIGIGVMYDSNSDEEHDWKNIIKSAVIATATMVISMMLFGLFLGG